ncbi:MAG: DNA-directed RNA polymerase subunit omega [Candidatus Marinimicrobia bacterium]|nr:DNA-directed RNA polymerase subunit omega [Candidatus Neomarinimicrobiota bacterium]
MAVDTIEFGKLLQKSKDVFEIIVAMARRANQINALRVAKNPVVYKSEALEEYFEDFEEEQEIDYDKIEKPTTMALKEMLGGRIEYRYATYSKSEEKQDETEG